jgi:hypothetical protein
MQIFDIDDIVEPHGALPEKISSRIAHFRVTRQSLAGASSLKHGQTQRSRRHRHSSIKRQERRIEALGECDVYRIRRKKGEIQPPQIGAGDGDIDGIDLNKPCRPAAPLVKDHERGHPVMPRDITSPNISANHGGKLRRTNIADQQRLSIVLQSRVRS